MCHGFAHIGGSSGMFTILNTDCIDMIQFKRGAGITPGGQLTSVPPQYANTLSVYAQCVLSVLSRCDPVVMENSGV